MNTIVLISCVSKKLSHKARARDLYVSPLFRLNLKLAKHFSPDEIYILSAKYGLLSLDEEIEPYDITLNKMAANERKKWAKKVVNQLKEHCDIENTHFILLAGEKYRHYLLPYLKSYEIPLEGMRIGKQLQYLKRKMLNE